MINQSANKKLKKQKKGVSDSVSEKNMGKEDTSEQKNVTEIFRDVLRKSFI